MITVNMLEYTKLMEKDVPTYRGIKYSNWDMTEASLLHNYGNSKYSIVFGVDQVNNCIDSLPAHSQV